jgi:hypothetical protein
MDRDERHRGRDADEGVQSSITQTERNYFATSGAVLRKQHIIALSLVKYPCMASTDLKDASGPYLRLRAGSHVHMAKGTFILIT